MYHSRNYCSDASASCSSWIGLYKTAADHTTLRWVDDTPFVYVDDGYYQPWIDGDPNNPSHQCIRAASDYNFNWSDRSCSDKFFVLCEGIAVTSGIYILQEVHSVMTCPEIVLEWLSVRKELVW